MTPNLLFALNYLFPNEGGYSNHPNDKGGATIWGVTKVEWERYFNRKFTDDEIRGMKKEDACRIYEQKYWLHAGLDKISDPNKAAAIFDQCVNWGVSVGVDMASHACNLAVNKSIGLTLEEIDTINEFPRHDFIMRFAELAKARYTWLALNPKYWVFRKGWLRRAERLKSLA